MRKLGVAMWVAMFGLAMMSFGQATDANLLGTVMDATGAVVPGAAVEATNTATGVKYNATTDPNGLYRFNNMPIGRYDVSASATGFATATVRGFDLQLNKNVTANITLQVGTVAATVDVSEAAASIDTTTAQVQTSFEGSQIANLPIIENATGLFGALNLSLLGAGVASNGGVGQGTGPSVGGQRPTNNNFTIEGIDNNNKAVTGPLIYVPVDATAEFTLLENQYGAEFGHSTGGQFNTVVKSGTNELHGSLYEYFQNRNLNAIGQEYQRQGFTSNPRFDQNRLGMTIGGPMIKDKLFYFGSVEYAPLGQAFTPGAPVLAPTAAGFSMLNSLPNISQTNLKILEQWVPPAPSASKTTTVNGVAIPIGILPIAAPNFTNYYSVIGSIDYNPSEKDQIRGRFLYNKSTSIDTNANLPGFWTPLPQRFYLITISDFHTFTPNLTNEFRLGFNRFTQLFTVGGQTFSGLDVFPNLQFEKDLGLQVGPDPNAPQFTIQNTYQLVENVNWTKGKHTLKMGIDSRDMISPQSFTQRVRGDYDYSTLEGYLLDQIPDVAAERNVGSSPYYGNLWSTGLYATDQWRIRPNLTLNLGVRWERTSNPESVDLQKLNAIANVPGLIEFNAPKVQNKNFAPRIGIAYSPGTSGNTSIRAGFGMGYDVMYDNLGILSLPPQLTSTIDTSPRNPGIYSAPFLANGGIRPNDALTGQLTAEEARANTSTWMPDQKLPYSIQWNIGVQHVFHTNYTVEVRYMGTRGVHEWVQQRMNTTNTPVTASRSLPTYLQAPSQAQLDSLGLTLTQLEAIDPLTPAFENAGFDQNFITAFLPIGNSSYHGLATQVTRRFTNGMQFIGAYTFSHNIDDSTASVFATLLSPRRPQDFNDWRAERATSALDRRQRLTFSWVYDAPWFRQSHSWLAKNVAGNWRFVGTYTAETGELATAASNIDSNLNLDSAGDRTIINPAGQANLGSGVTPLTNSAGETVAYLASNPNARYILAGPGAYPNGGRNTVQMPGINNFDLSLAKRFNITESKSVEFRCDASNAFNHPQYTSGYINSVRLTTQVSQRTFLQPDNTAFQNWSENFPSNDRTLQLALKLYF
ncbi:MAG TPA: TonB-dependent receptor [Bryobacteraceae bacterium]|nr:TonB-dependent receptor [Bryobacteraceae bacterium]